MKHLSLIFLCLMMLLPSAAAKPKRAPAPELPLDQQSAQNIVDKYFFVADFNVKPETRFIPGGEVFWRYPLTLPKIKFPIELKPITENDIPPMPGSGRFYEHLNRGRMLMIAGDYKEAKATWLSARARYGTQYPEHRRLDYLIALSFLYLADQEPNEKARRNHHNNAATFLSWAYQQKADHPDAFLDKMAPEAIYRLASVYYLYERYAAAYGATTDGLNFLRKTGRTEYRTQMRRMLAESYIQNRSYLEAVQEIDTAIRQDRHSPLIAKLFARVGDIYFDLNNFDLAEDAYALAGRIDRENRIIEPAQLVLRGESLFWLGRYAEAQKQFYFALNSLSLPEAQSDLPNEFAALASIRFADAWLARADHKAVKQAREQLTQVRQNPKTKDNPTAVQAAEKKLDTTMEPYEQAKLAYFKHINDFRGHPTEIQARLRLACLELPEYEGHNIEHARQLLEEVKSLTAKDDKEHASLAALPPAAIEMAWACQVASVAQHERTPEMVAKVKEFSKRYPNSDLLNQLVDPVREVQAHKIEPYFAANDLYGATEFFEKTRRSLYPHVTDDLKKQLFVAYVDTYRSEKAAEFYSSYAKTATSDLDMLRLAVAAAELAGGKKPGPWTRTNATNAKNLATRTWTIAQSPAVELMVDRIAATGAAAPHWPWMLQLNKTWAQGDVRKQCELVYPLVSRLNQTPHITPALRKEVTTTALQLVDSALDAAFKEQINCGHALLELEAQLLQKKPKVLAEKYLTRTFVPIDQITANLIWSLAESLHAQKNPQLSRALWQHLVNVGGTEIPEVKFAKARLDNRRTEFEKLWQ